MKTKQTFGKTNIVLKSGILIMLFLTSFVFNSCKKAEDKDAREVVSDQNETTTDNDNNKEKDATFLVEAATINLAEIELGKLAQTKAQSKGVKDFGKMMVDGHTKAFNELKTLAATKQIPIPQQLPDKEKEKSKDLMEAKGNEFDKMYVDKMVDGHKDAISKFESAEKDSKDADIKAWASKMLPDLHMHLEHAQALDENIK